MGSCRPVGVIVPYAGVAQLVEHLICNQRVRGSNPFASSSIGIRKTTKRGAAAQQFFSLALHKEAFQVWCIARENFCAHGLLF